jgi:hypothetical protein
VIATLFSDANFDLSLSNPLYDRTKKCVRELEPLAWQILRIRTFKTALPDLPPMTAKDQELISLSEYLQSVRTEELAETSDIEAYEAQLVHLFSTNLEVRSAMLMFPYWAQTNNQKAGLDFFRALGVYNELLHKERPRWSAHKLMMLCVMMACNECELASADMSAVDPEQLWDRAVKLYREIRSKASRPDPNHPNIYSLVRSSVFHATVVLDDPR